MMGDIMIQGFSFLDIFFGITILFPLVLLSL